MSTLRPGCWWTASRPDRRRRGCVGEGSLWPVGWLVTDLSPATSCTRSVYKIQESRLLVGGLPVGSTVDVCRDNPIPAGWEVTAYFSSTACLPSAAMTLR